MNQLRYHSLASPLGPLLLLANEADRLCGLYLPEHKRAPSAATARHDAGGVIDRAAGQLEEYFSGIRTTFDLPLATRGTPVQEHVWAALRSVPYGRTTTYGRIAADLGMGPGAARAVGTANARNPLSIIVPCHRVVGAGGSLTGYAGGLEAKRWLLTHEARITNGALDLNDDACWTMVQRRDPAADGRFIVGVRTTGVYCRPTCAGRPLRRNVVYFRNVEQARSYGLRACRRCAPDAAEAVS
ncbi:MAG TPA: methylated-DNA--[protein]-cysteine S-methyltransferase [Solirubrobacteraceae bacterium]|nr:methylated-DNA--[protein]-cysteine S-methyltransferase [Solirubrobacteraceae bacterium]